MPEEISAKDKGVGNATFPYKACQVKPMQLLIIGPEKSHSLLPSSQTSGSSRLKHWKQWNIIEIN